MADIIFSVSKKYRVVEQINSSILLGATYILKCNIGYADGFSCSEALLRVVYCNYRTD